MRNRKLLICLLFTAIMLILAACGSSTTKDASSEKKVSENTSSKETTEVEQDEEETSEGSQPASEETNQVVDYEAKFSDYMKTNNITLKARDVLFDMQNKLDQPFAIMGTASLDTYYNYGFQDLESTHFAVQITDKGPDYIKSWDLFFERAKYPELYESLKKGEVYVMATGVIPKSRYEDGQDEEALGLSLTIDQSSSTSSAADTGSMNVAAQYSQEKGLTLKAVDVLFDMQKHLDQKFLVSGKASLDTYYNYGFSSLEQSHFAVSVKDESTNKSWDLYFDRQKFADLFEALKQSEQYITATGVIPSSLYENEQGELAQGVDVEVGTGY